MRSCEVVRARSKSAVALKRQLYKMRNQSKPSQSTSSGHISGHGRSLEVALALQGAASQNFQVNWGLTSLPIRVQFKLH